MIIEGIKDFLIKVSFILIALQVIHLFWLTANVTLPLIGINEYKFNDGTVLFILLDYIEIPSIVIASTTYIVLVIRHDEILKNIFFMSLLVIQVIHIVWLTDEFIVNYFDKLPIYLIFIVALIDYTELAVLANLGKKAFKNNKIFRQEDDL